MKITKKEFDQDVLSLTGFGLLPEEIEAYFNFFDEEVQENKRVRMLNSGRTKKYGENK